MDAFGEPNIVPLDAGLDPFEIYRRISPKYSRSFLFESLTESAEMAETTVMGFEPTAVVRGYRDRIDVQGPGRTVSRFTEDPLGALRDTMRTACHDAHRYAGGAVGIVNYEAVTLAEDIPQSHDSPGPLFEFGLYDDGILADRRTGDVSYFWYDTDRSPILKGLCAAPPSGPEEPFHATTPESPTGMAEFARMVERARRYIYDGDIFQVVLSRRFNFEASGNPLALYSKLRQLNPSPYMFHLKQGDSTAIGASPEMLVRITGKIAETFPIAGTRPIGSTPALTERLAAELASDVKELAEHTMLVDLGRNDMGRVCRHGTVKPLSLMEVKRFSHVQHLVTHITGRLSDDKDMFDAFRAVFPAGTVSGAPKVRAMEIIDELEPHGRGPYAGAVGYFSYNGCCDFAIAIRSIFIGGSNGFVQSGAGIVSDSRPSREFEETQEKAGAMLQAIREADPVPGAGGGAA